MAETPNIKELDDLKSELKVAKNDMFDAKRRIERIELTIWGKDPFGIAPDPDAIINILRDIRDRLPDLQEVADDSKFNKRVLKTIFGAGGILATVILGWQIINIFM